MVVGHSGVGKTTLVKRLLGEKVHISESCSTEGIDVYINSCDVTLPYCEWTRRSKEQDYRLQRLARVLNEQKSVKDKVTQKEQVIILPQGETTHKSHEVTQIDVEGEESKVLYIRSPQHDVGQDLSSTDSQQEEFLPALVKTPLIQLETNIATMQRIFLTNSRRFVQYIEKTAPLTILDFAGQYAFYSTHQTFLTRRAIYLLVSDVSQQLTDLVADECYFDSDGIMKCKVHELIEVWLNLIHSCASSPEDRNPPVILVGTHMDKIKRINHHEICEEYFRKIRSYLKDKPTRFHLVDEDFAIDNTIVDSKLQDLKRKIVKVAKKQPYWGERIPARWLPLEQKLMRLKNAGIKVIPWSRLEELNTSLAVPMTTDELDLFLRFQHGIGTILYYSKDILKEKIVLDPQWMIDALKSLITAEMFVLRSIPAVNDKWFEFKEKGKLSLELVDAVWTQEKYLDLHVNKEHILLLMEQLNIIAKVRLYSEETSEIKLDHYHKLTIHFWDYIIFMRVTRKGITDKTPSSKLCIEAREFVSATLTKIIGYLGQSLKFDQFIQCPEYKGDSVNSLISVSLLNEKAEVCCTCHENIKESNKLLQFWFDDMASKKKKAGYARMQEKVYDIPSKCQGSPGGQGRDTGNKNTDVIGSEERTEYLETSNQTEEVDIRDSVELTCQTTSGEYPMPLQRRALPPGKKYHAFFIYSSSDIAWVKRTVETLENNHGFVCCEYDRDNIPGTPLLKFADDSIRNAYKTVVVMTKEALQSGFVLLEIEMAFRLGFREGRKCVVPILLEDCEVPGYLSVLNYVDACDINRRNIWWPKLLKELESTVRDSLVRVLESNSKPDETDVSTLSSKAGPTPDAAAGSM
ncbi:hypothetical protein CHS0354_034487 [Potamilus streckersoni]|uniref:TIR domain-containing protein n=1 Tax=Potamilus streckersoni TaxID=2493646 RepID=A0AAE0W6P7_9BIVA|nr:hypothetical protein CHS0354_034487 [Potamilus streckersoni]